MENKETFSSSQKFMIYGALVGLVSPIIWIFLIIIAAYLYPAYSHTTNFISDLGSLDAPNPFYQRINFFQFGIANALLGFVLYKALPRPSIIVLLFQLLIGLGIFLSGIFPGHTLDPNSYESFLHNIVGIPAFILISLTPLISGINFRKNNNWKILSLYSMIMTPALAILLFLMIRADVTSDGLPGLFQRLFLGIWIVWIVMVSLRILKLKTGRSLP